MAIPTNKEIDMTNEVQGVAETDPPSPTLTTIHDGVTLAGIDAWAAAFVSSGVNADLAKTIAGNCLHDGYDQGFAAGKAGLEPTPAPTATDHRARSKLDALHIALQHCAVSGQRDIDKITDDAEKFWQWLIKEIN